MMSVLLIGSKLWIGCNLMNKPDLQGLQKQLSWLRSVHEDTTAGRWFGDGDGVSVETPEDAVDDDGEDTPEYESIAREMYDDDAQWVAFTHRNLPAFFDHVERLITEYERMIDPRFYVDANGRRIRRIGYPVFSEINKHLVVEAEFNFEPTEYLVWTSDFWGAIFDQETRDKLKPVIDILQKEGGGKGVEADYTFIHFYPVYDVDEIK